MENILKINQILDGLNREHYQAKHPGDAVPAVVPPVWQPVQDYFAVTGFSYNNGNPLFNPNFGYPMKAFVNNETGEVKMYSAKSLEL